jgi:hypothetical protein
MPTHEQILEQIRARKCEADFLTRREVKQLSTVLHENEQLYNMASGFLENATWLIVCTDQRVVLLNCGFFGGLKLKEFQLKSISSVEQSTGFAMGEIAISVSGNRMLIKQIAKERVKYFVDTLNWARSMVEQKPVSEPVEVRLDVADQLERLAALRDRGILSETEFAEQKAKVLAGT